MEFNQKLNQIENDLHLIDERFGSRSLKNIKEIDDRLASIFDLINFQKDNQGDLRRFIDVFEEFEYKYKKILRN